MAAVPMNETLASTGTQAPDEPLLKRNWAIGLGLLCLAVFVLVPVGALVLPAGHALHLSDYALTLTGKILCYAVAALALGLVWGYCGILSLGHALFFALGGYAFGMYLMREASGNGLPPFMTFLSWTELPWYWWGTSSFLWAMVLVVLVPGLLALVFGYFTFRSRVKGVYLSIITQALTFAAMLLFFRNETGFGGNNGFTGFTTILGYPIASSTTRVALLLASFSLLVIAFLACRALVGSRYGQVLTAIRDAETRTMFLGYRPLGYKLFAWTLSAVLCGLAGALYVPQVGIINPSEMAPVNSIEMAIWVAVGGRGTLLGPIIGAIGVNGAKTLFTTWFAQYWLFFLGAIFVLAPLLLPRGIIGLFGRK
ncbi:urea ABC transporter permease subunit UrtC [Verticiella sediminum]|uniref:Urea ABC transporter permease subunit UrtC n=1 Tax=Verticiella sediminum TaxID=1247510 RepID=A0A556ABG7_9BURK|nr:urea ABC transporter permease subunit UrtC [Verticiella sediminum]TSH90239.1 urea ABC transporter permease subunit UrtC [Verticiella sediminum]